MISKNLTAIRKDLALELDLVLTESVPSLKDKNLKDLLRNFHPTDVDLRTSEGSVHGRSKWETALSSASEFTVRFQKRLNTPTTSAPSSEPPTPPNELEQLLESFLAAAKSKRFVSLKWFRDTWLPSQQLTWAADPNQVQTLLRAAIDTGLLRKEQIANPNNPDHPTTVLKEGNSTPNQAGARKNREFKPIRLLGAPLSQTILEGR